MEISSFRQSVAGIQLSVECATEAVPNDGQYYVLLAGEVLFKSKSKRRALEVYRDHREQLLAGEDQERVSDPRAALEREIAYYQAGFFRAEASRTKVLRAKRKGGKSQGGGVGR